MILLLNLLYNKISTPRKHPLGDYPTTKSNELESRTTKSEFFWVYFGVFLALGFGGVASARSRIFESSEILILGNLQKRRMPTKTLTLQSGCAPHVMGVFEGSIEFSCERRLSHSPQLFQTYATI